MAQTPDGGAVREGGRLLSAPIAANPDVPFVIDVNAVVRHGPVITFARTTPMADQVAGFIEFEYRGRGGAAFRGDWLHGKILLFRLERALTVNHPDVIVRIHGDADHGSDHPVIGQRFRP